jgi:hypothetical protein
MGVGLFLRRIYPGSLLSGGGLVSTALQRAHVKTSGDFGFADAGLMQFPDLGGKRLGLSERRAATYEARGGSGGICTLLCRPS